MCAKGWKGATARQALSAVDRSVVHSHWKRQVLSDWLKLPLERFQFVPLQRASISLTETEETEHPFLLALGTAHRDYRTLFAAVEKLQLPTVVVAGHHALEGLHLSVNVTICSGLTPDECYQLAQRARTTLVPLEPTPTAARASNRDRIDADEAAHYCHAMPRHCGLSSARRDRTAGSAPRPLALSETIDAIW